MGGNNQLNKLPNLVAPRVTHFQGRDRVPISVAIEAMLCPSQREVVSTHRMGHALVFTPTTERNWFSRTPRWLGRPVWLVAICEARDSMESISISWICGARSWIHRSGACSHPPARFLIELEIRAAGYFDADPDQIG